MTLITYVPAPGYDTNEKGVINAGSGTSFDVGAALISGGGQFTVDDQITPTLVSVLDKFPGVIRSNATPGPVITLDIIGPVLAHSKNATTGDILVRGADGLFAPSQPAQLPSSVVNGVQAAAAAAQTAAEASSLPATTTLDTIPAALADVSANGHKLISVADATADTDALNRRSADARYGGVSAATVVDQALSPKDIDSTGVVDGYVLTYSSALGLYVPLAAASGGGGGGGTALVPTTVKTAAYGPAANDFARYNISGGSISDVLPNAPADGTVVGTKIVAAQSSPIGSASSAGTLNSLTISTQGADTFPSGATTKKMYALGHAITWQYKATDKTWTAISADPGTTSPWCCVGPATNVNQTTVAQPVGFCIDALGVVRLRGYVTSTAQITAGTTLWTLPFAPSQLTQFDQVYAAVVGLIPQITTGGAIQSKGTWNNALYGNLDGKSFVTT